MQVREESLTLAPNERILVNLRVVPLRAGSLNIEGVAWTLSDVAHGQAQFRIPRPMPRKQGRSKYVACRVLPLQGAVHVPISSSACGLPPACARCCVPAGCYA